MTIEKLYAKVLHTSTLLQTAIDELANKASEVYGQKLEASLCDGCEIEFRLPEEAFFNEIRIEELIEMEKEQKKRR